MAQVFLAADVGGTFTDLVLVDAAGRLFLDKLPSAETGSGQGVLDGIARLTARAGIGPGDLDLFVHGFTVGTNAFLTRRGAKAALVVTAGFRDVLLIGDQMRPELYDLRIQKPAPVIPRSMTLEVTERLDAFGQVVTPLAEAEVARVAEAVAALEPQSVAIALAFAYLDDAHEKRLAEAIRARLPGVPVYLGSRVNPQIEEYPRANTTAVAAYVGPVVGGYVERLARRLAEAGVTAPLRLMRSDGGVATPRAAMENPAHMLLSGPAAGVVAGAALAAAIGRPDLVTFDMGGTSADFSLIQGGQPALVPARHVDGQPLRLPALDIETISAGGGSIATVDDGGALKVGPQSAGAVPGPACYGKGGQAATVTDAAVVLGLLAPDAFLGGEIPLDPALAAQAVRRAVAEPLGLSLPEAASGIVAVAVANMVQAIRKLSVERGHDIRRFGLVAAGGAGPLYAGLMARELGMAEVLVPAYPGLFCALGLLQSDLRHAMQRAWRRPLDQVGEAALGAALAPLAEELAAALEADGIPPADRRLVFEGDLRALGQFHQLQVPLPAPGPAGWWSAEALAAAFHAAHERAYGHADPAAPVEFVNLRAYGLGTLPRPEIPPPPAGGAAGRPVATRQVLLERSRGFEATAVWRRADLALGQEIAGPAIVTQRDSTTVVLAGQRLTVHPTGVLRVAV
jgi:N-methylhydantoinase A